MVIHFIGYSLLCRAAIDGMWFTPPFFVLGCALCRCDFIEDPETSPDNKAPLEKWQKDGILVLSGLPDAVVRRPDIVVKRPPRWTEQVPASPR